MTDDKAIVPTDSQVYLGTITVTPEEVVDRATKVATALNKVIRDRRLFSTIQGKDYVHVDGWTTLGAMLGVLPREVSVTRLEDGGYEATVELIRTSDGMVIGRGSALCGMDEKDRKGVPTWADRPEYARRSMAITRATGKAYRLGFSWIMELAGYATTPAEEVQGIVDAEAVTADDWAKHIGPEEIHWLIENQIVPPDAHVNHIVNLLDLSPFKPGENFKNERGLSWFRIYRHLRNDAKEKGIKATARDIAKIATSEWPYADGAGRLTEGGLT